MPILLLRHGETAANAARVVQLPTEPLNRRGIGQAKRAAERIRGSKLAVTRVLCSDLERARMTAQPIYELTGVEIESEPLLQERNFGDLRGRPYADLGLDPMAEGYHPPAGESWRQFHERAARAWKRVESCALELENDEVLVVVTHGLVCRSFAERHLDLGDGGPAPARWANTSWTEIESRAPWRVSVLNCTGHLDDGYADAPASASGL